MTRTFLALWFGGMTALALAIAWARGESLLWTPASPGHGRLSLSVQVGLGLAIGTAVGLLSRWWVHRHVEWRAMAAELGAAIGIASLRSVVGWALASAVAEELLFRGALQPWLGWVAASALFGLVHFRPQRRLASIALVATAMGFLLGWEREVTGSLLAPIATHAMANGIAFHYFLTVRGERPSAANAG